MRVLSMVMSRDRQAPAEGRQISGMVVAVTGGARGIGRATATAMHAQGARVAIGDLDGDLAAAEASRLGEGALGLGLDVTDAESFRNFLIEVERRLGPLDVLVNSAGILPVASFLEEGDATTKRVIGVNLQGSLLGARLAIEGFLSRGSGEVVNIVGIAGRVGLAGGVTYSAAQHALTGMSTALRQELRGTGIGVRVVMPVMVDTDLTLGLSRPRGLGAVSADLVADAVVHAVRSGVNEVYVPGWVGRVLALTPLVPGPVRRVVRRALGVDRILARPETEVRESYEERVKPRGEHDPSASIASAAASVASAVEAEDGEA